MAPRDRRVDHDRGDRDRDAGRGQPAARRVILQDFFLESEGISREVLNVETPKYLGPEATCRPGQMNGQTGFIIKASRPFTPDMVEDLRNLSQAFELENRTNQRQHYQDKSYVESDTRSRYATNPAVLSQPANLRYVPSTMAYGNSIPYTSGPGYQSTPSFSDPSYPPNPRYPVDPGYSAGGPAFSAGSSRGIYQQSGPDQRFEPNYIYAPPQPNDYSRGPPYDAYGGPAYTDTNSMMSQRSNMSENFPFSTSSSAGSRPAQAEDRYNMPRDYEYRQPPSNVPYGYDRGPQHPFSEPTYDRRTDRDPMDYTDVPRRQNFGPQR